MPKDLERFLAWLEDHAAADEYLDVRSLVEEFLGKPLPPILIDEISKAIH